MRITFWEPSDPAVLQDPEKLALVLGLVSASIPPEIITMWTPHERLMAYDWAMREYYRASDNPVRSRPRPSFAREPD